MQFKGETIEFISTYFFETEETDDNYRTIVSILGWSAALPCATCFVFSYLVYFYTEWIARRAEQYIRVGNNTKVVNTENGKCIKIYAVTDDNQNKEDEEKEKQNRKIKILALILASTCLCIILFILHIIASVKLIEYYGEVLNDAQSISIVTTVLSFTPTALLLICFIPYYSYQNFRLQDVDKRLGKLLQLSLGMLIIYLGFYFSPYMLLAFINDPIQTGFIYLIGGPVIFVVYLASYTFCLVIVKLCSTRKCPNIDVKSNFGNILQISFVYASAISIVYFVLILIAILTLGNFDDFQAVQNLTLPIIIGLLSFFVFQPFFTHIKESMGIYPTDEVTPQNSDAKEAKNVKITDNTPV